MAALEELDFLHVCSGVPRHVFKETERQTGEREREQTQTYARWQLSPLPHSTGRRSHKSRHGFNTGRNIGPTSGGRQEGRETYVDVAIFEVYSLPLWKEVRK